METKEKTNSSDNGADSNLESLDSQSTTVVDSNSESLDSTDATQAPAPDDKKKKDKKKRRSPVKGLAGKFNIYLLLLVFIILIAGIVTFVSYQRNKDTAAKEAENVSTTPLSDEDLEKLRQTDVKVGDPKQTLSVESNAVFAGKVLIRDSLEVAGQIKVGGPLNLPGISVSGSTVLDEVEINNLQISGNATVQGQFNVQADAAVTGNLTVGGIISAGSLNVEQFQINGNLQLNRHIDAGGGTPSRSTGTALGAGGTASVSGTDTAGTVNINTGGSTVAGCFVTITFTTPFNAPHVVITPVGSAAGTLNYYINRSSTNFSICTRNAAPVGQSFAFDYIVID